ncbi:MAG: hypothetical protein ACTSO7_03670 [Candidatus Heimdallarchaeota archaeon]
MVTRQSQKKRKKILKNQTLVKRKKLLKTEKKTNLTEKKGETKNLKTKKVKKSLTMMTIRKQNEKYLFTKILDFKKR